MPVAVVVGLAATLEVASLLVVAVVLGVVVVVGLAVQGQQEETHCVVLLENSWVRWRNKK